MSGGLAALLDDIAMLAKLAAASLDDVGAAAGKASTKSLGVVVDDAAVTPRYVNGFAAERELPVIRKIAVGSIRNKLIFILPAILLLSQFVPWLITPILMLGGLYLSYEGAEKVWEVLLGHTKFEGTAATEHREPADEDAIVRSAITTDLILSAEIMIIALGEVTSQPFLARAIILVIVALLITVAVYGVVALIVKMDDVGLHLAKRQNRASQAVGRTLVKAMPIVLKVLTVVGVVAMMWVGGHILLAGTDTLGWHWLYQQVHHLETWVAGAAPAAGAFLAWLANTLASTIIGFVVGSLAVGVWHVIPRRKRADAPTH